MTCQCVPEYAMGSGKRTDDYWFRGEQIAHRVGNSKYNIYPDNNGLLISMIHLITLASYEHLWKLVAYIAYLWRCPLFEC